MASIGKKLCKIIPVCIHQVNQIKKIYNSTHPPGLSLKNDSCRIPPQKVNNKADDGTSFCSSLSSV